MILIVRITKKSACKKSQRRLKYKYLPACHCLHKYRRPRKKEMNMQKQKNVREMNRREYCSYVQQHYCNDPQWVRTRLISKWDQDHEKKNSVQAEE